VLVEVAFVLPIAVMFTLGILQFCLYLCAYIGGTYASRMAVRYAVVHGATSLAPCTAVTLDSQIQPYLFALPQDDVTITTTWSPDTNPGSIITVKLTYSYASAIPFDALTLTSVTSAVGTIVQ
jgi:hypothetical protein